MNQLAQTLAALTACSEAEMAAALHSLDERLPQEEEGEQAGSPLVALLQRVMSHLDTLEGRLHFARRSPALVLDEMLSRPGRRFCRGYLGEPGHAILRADQDVVGCFVHLFKRNPEHDEMAAEIFPQCQQEEELPVLNALGSEKNIIPAFDAHGTLIIVRNLVPMLPTGWAVTAWLVEEFCEEAHIPEEYCPPRTLRLVYIGHVNQSGQTSDVLVGIEACRPLARLVYNYDENLSCPSREGLRFCEEERSENDSLPAEALRAAWFTINAARMAHNNIA